MVLVHTEFRYLVEFHDEPERNNNKNIMIKRNFFKFDIKLKYYYLQLLCQQ